MALEQTDAQGTDSYGSECCSYRNTDRIQRTCRASDLDRNTGGFLDRKLSIFLDIFFQRDAVHIFHDDIINTVGLVYARVVLFISFATQMTTWPLPRGLVTADATTGATPLGVLAEGGEKLPELSQLFLGNIGGSVGEVSAIALLIGGCFLVWKKIISPIIPCCFIGTVFVFALIYYAAAGVPECAEGYSVLGMALFHIFAGGVMLGAIFMATDYVTSPTLPLGKVIFAVGCGLLTMIIRLWGQYPEGVSFSILLMNILTPLIDNFAMKQQIKKYEKKEGAQ